MDKRSKIGAMLRARDEIGRVMDTLDLSEGTCGECGSRRYDNFDDTQLSKKLSGLIQKLDNEIQKLKGGPKKGRGDFHYDGGQR